MKLRIRKSFYLPLILFMALPLLLTECNQAGGSEGKDLEQGFQNPPEAAKPRVWWHWMNGNVTWEGAKADMDWMVRTGIGGLQCFDAGMTTPQSFIYLYC